MKLFYKIQLAKPNTVNFKIYYLMICCVIVIIEYED